MCLSTHRRASPPPGQVSGALRRVHALCVTFLFVASLTSHGARAEPCSLHKFAELPVTMVGLRPTVHARVNGKDAVFIADSGAMFRTITRSGAKELNMRLQQTRNGISVVGVGYRAGV